MPANKRGRSHSKEERRIMPNDFGQQVIDEFRADNGTTRSGANSP
ncbi:hypothetical protein [Streptomyces glaucosporus]